MSYDEAINYIHSLSVFGIRPGLSRIRKLLEMAGNPQKGMKFVHIAGTNGKGSVCSMLSSILLSSGYKTGLYTSPYISFFEERMQINGTMIPKDRLTEIVSLLKNYADNMEDKPTEFEFITAAAFLYFYEEKCDVVVLETGLGGRLDATNVIENPLLTVITGIDLDHTKILGDTIEKIAFEKGGIIKNGCPIVLARCDGAALNVLKDIAEEKHAPLTTVDYNRFTCKSFFADRTEICVSPYGRIKLSLAGVYQADNAAVVITAAEVLKKIGLNISEKNIINGLSSAVWPARFQTLSTDPLIIYEGAHNPNGVSALKENIEKIIRSKIILVCSVMADKDYMAMAKMLAPDTEKVFAVKCDNPRALDSDSLSKTFSSFGVDAVSAGSVYEGVSQAIEHSKKTSVPIVIAGTLYMYAEAKFSVQKLKGIK